MMKKLILLALFLSPLVASAQVGQFIPFIRWTNATGTNSTTTTLAISSIASGNCLQTSTGGAVISSGAACGTGGFPWPFTKQADNSQGTTTVMSFLGGFYSSASSTLSSFHFGTATGTSATTTNLFSTNGTFTGLRVGTGATTFTGDVFFPFGAGTIIFNSTDEATEHVKLTGTNVSDQLGIQAGSDGDIATLDVSQIATSDKTFTFPNLSGTFLLTDQSQNFILGSGTTTNATSTNLYLSNDFYISPLTSALLQTGANGKVAEYAGTTCTNQFVRALSALGIATCATVANTDLANSTISGVALGSNLAALTNGLTLNGSSYNGSGAISDWDINLTNANNWTALQTFTNATSTLFSSTIASTSQLILSGASDGCLNVTSGNVSSTGVACGSGGGTPYPFPLSVNATSSVVGFYNGWLSSASSTNTGSTTLATTLMTNATSTNLFVSSLASTTNLRANTALFGNVGISTTSPVATAAIEQNGENFSFQVSNNGSSTPSFVVRGVNGDGNVGIGTSSPNLKLEIAQTNAIGSYTLSEIVGTRSTVFAKATMTTDPLSPRLVGASIGEAVMNMTVAPAAAVEAGGFNGACTVASTDSAVYPGTSICKGGGVFGAYLGTGSINRVNGLTSSTLRFGAGTVTNLGSIFSQVTNLTGSGTTVHAYHLYLQRPSSTAGATWSTTTAIYIENQTPAAGTLTTGAFGIYQDGNSNRNYFGGTVGVNVISPGSRLHTKGGTNDALLVEDDSGLCEAQPTTTGLTWSCSSDERLKSDIAPTTYKAIDYLNSIPLFDYTVIKTGERVTGPVAQRLIASHPELVTLTTSSEKSDQTFGENNEQYQVSEPGTWKIVKAIQEAWVKIMNHESRIDQLERENVLLRARLDALEARVLVK